MADPEPEIEWLLEQLDAAKEIVHTYKCAVCRMASAVSLVLIIDSDDPGGTRVVMVGICGVCSGEGNQ